MAEVLEHVCSHGKKQIAHPARPSSIRPPSAHVQCIWYHRNQQDRSREQERRRVQERRHKKHSYKHKTTSRGYHSGHYKNYLDYERVLRAYKAGRIVRAAALCLVVSTVQCDRYSCCGSVCNYFLFPVSCFLTALLQPTAQFPVSSFSCFEVFGFPGFIF